MYPSSSNIKDAEGNLLVTSYVVHRPDGEWSVMLVNRDETNPHTVRVVFDNAKSKKDAYFSGPVTFSDLGQRAVCVDQRWAQQPRRS